MTYIIGWKSDNSVFISGDMVVTTEGDHPPKLSQQLSSFQEKHYESNEKVIQESLQKVLDLESKIIVGFAGDIKIASDLADNISLRVHAGDLTSLDGVGHLISQTIDNCLTEETKKMVQFVLGVMISGRPSLHSYNAYTDQKIRLHDDLVQIGSLSNSQIYTNISKVLSTLFINGRVPDERLLTCVNAIIQSYGVHDNLIESYGVGGAIVGVRLSENGVSWQNDTTYIIYHDISTNMSIINFSIINGITVLRDSEGHYRTFVNAQNHNAPPNNIFSDPKMIHAIKEHVNSDTYKYLVFLNRKHRQITIIERNEHSQNSAYVKFEIENENDTFVTINPQFAGLLTDNKKSENAVMPYRITFLEDRDEGSEPNQIQVIKGKIQLKTNV